MSTVNEIELNVAVMMFDIKDNLETSNTYKCTYDFGEKVLERVHHFLKQEGIKINKDTDGLYVYSY